MTGRRTRRLAVASVLLAASVLAGCASDGDEPEAGDTAGAGASPTETPTGTAGATPYLPVPEGVELTAQGSQLDLGDSAVVAWQPRQSSVGVIDVRVTRVERTTFEKSFQGWKLEPKLRKSTPYFVRSKVTNVGDTDLGGRRVPLYALTDDNALIDYSVFQGTFKPCPSTHFPEKFAPDATITLCQVHLVPPGAELAGIAFRPSEEVAPVIWTGAVSEPGDGERGGKGEKKQDGQQG